MVENRIQSESPAEKFGKEENARKQRVSKHQQALEKTGKVWKTALRRVDIVGVTGSIPVPPTIVRLPPGTAHSGSTLLKGSP